MCVRVCVGGVGWGGVGWGWGWVACQHCTKRHTEAARIQSRLIMIVHNPPPPPPWWHHGNKKLTAGEYIRTDQLMAAPAVTSTDLCSICLLQQCELVECRRWSWTLQRPFLITQHTACARAPASAWYVYATDYWCARLCVQREQASNEKGGGGGGVGGGGWCHSPKTTTHNENE